MGMLEELGLKPEDIGLNKKNEPQLSSDERLQSEHPNWYAFGKWLQEHPSISKPIGSLAETVTPFNKAMQNAVQSTGLSDVGGGLTESLLNTGISAANLPLETIFGEEARIPNFDASKYIKSPGMAYYGGRLLGDLYAGKKGLDILNKVGGRPSGYLGLLTDLLKGGALGYTIGENKEGGGRELAAGLGGVANILGSIMPKTVANRIMSDKQKALQQAKKGYGNLFKTAEKEGAKIDKVPNIEFNKIIKGSQPKYNESLKKFEFNPTIENAHKAQSDMGKLITNLNKQPTLTSSQQNLLKSAIDAQKRLKGSIFEAFERTGNKTLSSKYGKLTADYAEKVIPYTKNPQIKAFGKKLPELTLEDFLTGIKGNKKFKAQLLKKYPELTIGQNVKEFLPSASKLAMAGYGSLGAGGTVYGYNKLFGGHE